ncbi:MAG TPA: hypothetical protein H9822_08230 [Candidatus Yaniella excrementavium]|nr:hypothetical protein [Candidatus Yaniella excrementavium]
MKFSTKTCVTLAAAGFLLAGCSDTPEADVEHLTIVTTSSILDQASSMAVSEYLQGQGTTVEIQDHNDSGAVFDALATQTADDHAVIGIVTAQQEPDSEDQALQLPHDLEVIAQAPADLGLVAAASTMTSEQLRRDLQENTADDEASEHLAACDDLTWIHAQTPADEVEVINAELAMQSCTPEFEAASGVDAEAYDELTARLATQPDVVAMLFSLDPMISDQGLATLDVATDTWPHSSVVAVSSDTGEPGLSQEITAVLEEINGESATELLRNFHNARRSTSDLDYEQDHAIRYWLARQDLIDSDTVTDNSADTGQ